MIISVNLAVLLFCVLLVTLHDFVVRCGSSSLVNNLWLPCRLSLLLHCRRFGCCCCCGRLGLLCFLFRRGSEGGIGSEGALLQFLKILSLCLLYIRQNWLFFTLLLFLDDLTTIDLESNLH